MCCDCGAPAAHLIPGLGVSAKTVRVSSYNSEALLHSLTMTTRRLSNNDRWDDQEEASSQGGEPIHTPAFPSLTREEAQALRAKQPSLSPWRVVGTQAVVGVVMALLAALLMGEKNWAWSVLYGAATVVVPGALMARGMTSRLSSMNPGTSGDVEDWSFCGHAGAGAETGATVELAGLVGQPGGLHEGVLGCAVVARPEKIIAFTGRRTHGRPPIRRRARAYRW
jgi:hypothetical protein